MKCKIVMVLVVSVVTSFVCGRMLFAQYTGGGYDGYAMGSFSASSYTGGSYDGYAMGSFTGSLYNLPSVTTGSATSVTTSSATLNGTVTTNGTTTTTLFQYSTTSGSYTGTSTQTIITGSSTSAVSSTISSLSAGTIYYYRIAANNSSGTSTGSEASFNTAYNSPSVTTGPATSVTTNSAILNGTVGTNGTTTTALFQYGTASGTYTGTSTQSTITGSSTSAVSSAVSSLSAVTMYYYRLAANNSVGTSTGSEASFTTSSSSGGGGGGVKEKLTVSSTSPSSGATGVSVDSKVSATFSMYIKGSTLTTDTFKLSGGDGGVSGSVSTDGTKAAFTPSGKLAYNTEFTATITTRVAAANAAGTSLGSDYSWSFTTESATTETPTPASTVTPASTPSSPTPVASPTPAITPTTAADMSLSKAVAYLSGDTVAVTVVDADRDSNPTSEDTLTTALKVTALNYYAGDDLILDLKENAVNSGTFLATIKTGTVTTGGASVSSRGTVPRAHYFYIKTVTATSVGASSSVRSNLGTIKTVQGGTATVVYTDTAPSASTITKTLSFYSSDATLVFDAESFTVGSYAVVTHVDAEENEDATKVNTLLNHAVIETSSLNRAWMKLAETGADTGTFKGSILVSSEATLDYERIQASNGDTLTAGCTDEINTSGAPRQVTAVSRVVSLEPTPTPTPDTTPTPIPSPISSPVECTAGKMALSPGKLNLKRNESGEATVTVTGTNGCPVEGKLAAAKVSKGRKLVSVSPASQETDKDGKAVFTIKTKNKRGSARVTFHVEEFKKSMSVTVKK